MTFSIEYYNIEWRHDSAYMRRFLTPAELIANGREVYPSNDGLPLTCFVRGDAQEGALEWSCIPCCHSTTRRLGNFNFHQSICFRHSQTDLWAIDFECLHREIFSRSVTFIRAKPQGLRIIGTRTREPRATENSVLPLRQSSRVHRPWISTSINHTPWKAYRLYTKWSK